MQIATACEFKRRIEPIRQLLAWMKDELGIEAVAAGGALRDIWHGHAHEAIKDLDIFFPANHTESLIAALVAGGSTVKVRYISHGKMAEEVCVIIDALFIEHEEGEDPIPWNVQFLGLAQPLTPQQTVERIDIGLCRIGITATMDIVTPEFLKDSDRRTMTALRADDVRRSALRFIRLHNKYPGFKFVADGYDERGNPLEGHTVEVQPRSLGGAGVGPSRRPVCNPSYS